MLIFNEKNMREWIYKENYADEIINELFYHPFVLDYSVCFKILNDLNKEIIVSDNINTENALEKLFEKVKESFKNNVYNTIIVNTILILYKCNHKNILRHKEGIKFLQLLLNHKCSKINKSNLLYRISTCILNFDANCIPLILQVYAEGFRKCKTFESQNNFHYLPSVIELVCLEGFQYKFIISDKYIQSLSKVLNYSKNDFSLNPDSFYSASYFIQIMRSEVIKGTADLLKKSNLNKICSSRGFFTISTFKMLIKHQNSRKSALTDKKSKSFLHLLEGVKPIKTGDYEIISSLIYSFSGLTDDEEFLYVLKKVHEIFFNDRKSLFAVLWFLITRARWGKEKSEALKRVIKSFEEVQNKMLLNLYSQEVANDINEIIKIQNKTSLSGIILEANFFRLGDFGNGIKKEIIDYFEMLVQLGEYD